MKKTILVMILGLALGCAAYAAAVQTTFNVSLSFTDNAQRDNAIVSYCEAYGLDIYVTPNTPASGVDVAKAAAAFRSHVRLHIKSVVIARRLQLKKEATVLTPGETIDP